MIRHLKLQNFQSHQDTEIEFHPGVNAIIGSSDSGKSAILRGLYWMIQNKPSANALLSHWAKDKDGKQTLPISVTIETENDCVNIKRIQRTKTTTLNGYYLNSVCLEAIGKDVPEQIQTALNLTDVNLQRQLDAPFLLSESAGEVARFFNQIIKLDDIDKVLSSADSMKRQTNSDLRSAETQQRQLTEQHKKYEWVENAGVLYERVCRMDERLSALNAQAMTAEKLVSDAELILQNLKKFRALEPVIKTIAIIEELQTKLINQKDQVTYYTSFIQQYIGVEQNIKAVPELTPISEQVQLAEVLYNNLEKEKATEGILNDSIFKLNMYTEVQQTEQKKIEDLTAKLPALCPLCGGKLTGGTDDSHDH